MDTNSLEPLYKKKKQQQLRKKSNKQYKEKDEENFRERWRGSGREWNWSNDSKKINIIHYEKKDRYKIITNTNTNTITNNMKEILRLELFK